MLGRPRPPGRGALIAGESSGAAPKKPRRARKPGPARPRKKKAATQVSVESVGVDALLYMPGRVLPAIVQILTVPVLTYYFAVEEIGRYDLTFRFVLFLSTFTFMWLNMGILRFYAPYEKREERVFAPITGLIKYFTIIIGVALSIALYFSGFGAEFGIYPDLLLPGIAVFVGYSFYETGLAVLRAKRKPVVYSLATTLNAGVRLPLAIACFVWLGMGIEGMLWAMAFMYLFSYMVGVQRHVGWPGWPHTKERQKLLRDVLYYGLPVWLTQILNFFLTNLDRYLIKALASSPEIGLTGVGLYSVATNLVDQPMLLVFQTFTLAVFPSVVAVWERDGKAATEQLVTGLTRVYFLMCVPLVVCFTVLAQPIFEVLAHGEARYAYNAAFWLATASFFYGLSYFASFGLHVSKRTQWLLMMTVGALAVNLATNLVLIPWEGYIGAGQARLLSNFVLTAAVAAAGYKHLRWRLPFFSFLRIFAASLGAGGIVWLMSKAIAPYWWSLLLFGACAGVAYFALLLVVGEVSMKEIRNLGANGLSRLRGK